jgi:hypothetical protein
VPKWKKDAKEFEMRVNNDQKGSRFVRIPKPLDEFFKIPNTLKFTIKGKTVMVDIGEK